MTNDKLKAFRLLLGISTKEAAEHFDVAQRTWQTYEYGTRPVPDWLDEAVRLAVWHNSLDVYDLLEEANPFK